ncbi:MULTISPECIES: exonuclease domain-containing protein [unclassified Agrococcus]|uniref:exonuclease domain-containing protein n=1 Tax=unclassified Agrococcus TaxID=2615065 RepID=UPI00361F8B5C
MAIDFTAIDFETANGSPASACSVGLVKVRDSRIVDRASWLIRPPLGHDAFSHWNVRIHGIQEHDVADAPRWHEQHDRLLAFVGGDVLVAHNVGFDKGVLKAASVASGLAVPDTRWTCSLRIARKTYHLDSYRLPVAAMAAGFEDFTHHDAAADAEACATIVTHAAARHGASDLEHLARICATRIEWLGPLAQQRTLEREPADAWWRP